MIIPPLNKRNTHDKAKDLCITSERPIGELGVRYLSALNLSREGGATPPAKALLWVASLGGRARVDSDDTGAAAPYLILSYLCKRTERGKWASRDTGPMSLGRYLIDA